MGKKIQNLIKYCQKHPESELCQTINPGGTPKLPGIPDGHGVLRQFLQFLGNEEVILRPSDWYSLAVLLNEAGFYQDALNIARVAEEQIEGANYLAHAQIHQIQGAALQKLNMSEASSVALDMAEKLLTTANLQNRLQNSINRS